MGLRHISSILLLLACGLGACQKKELPAPVIPGPATPADTSHHSDTTLGTLSFQIKHVVADRDLVLKSEEPYTLARGDQFTVSTYNYYLTNIVLINEHGDRFAEPESYRLVMLADPGSYRFTIDHVPAGNYTSVEFLIGVDSVRNFSGAQSGALDPVHGMFWGWNTGYIMAKLEGSSPQSKATDGLFSYHIAGFKAPDNVIRKVTLSLPEAAVAGRHLSPVIHLKSDLATWFMAPNFPGFAAMSSIGAEGRQATAMADNYSTMFSSTQVDN